MDPSPGIKGDRFFALISLHAGLPTLARHFHYFSHYGTFHLQGMDSGKNRGTQTASIKFEYGNIGIPRLYRLNVLPLPQPPSRAL